MKEKFEVIVVCGPTASGKTAKAIELADKVNGEIVSVDSVQIYRHMDIGSAKPPKAILEQYPHHMIDIIDPDQRYNAADYATKAIEAVRGIIGRGKIPILTGGAGLYFKALFQGFFDGPRADIEIRKRLENAAMANGPTFLYQRLADVDPVAAREIHPKNVRRIIRALEVFEITGVPISEHKKKRPEQVLVAAETFFLNPPRAALYQAINERTDRMFLDGLIGETRSLCARYCADAPGLLSLGYQECIRHLAGEMSAPETVELVKKNTRNYAKRQITWFKNQPMGKR